MSELTIRVGHHALYPVTSDDGQRMWASQPEPEATAIDVVFDSDLALIEAMASELASKPSDTTTERPGEVSVWAWAVVDPNNRLQNNDGEVVDMLICWDRDTAASIRDDAEDEMEEGEEEKPHIVDLVPASELATIKARLACFARAYAVEYQTGFTQRKSRFP